MEDKAMTALVTFYLSQILGTKIIARDGEIIGKVTDLLVTTSQADTADPARTIVVSIKSGTRKLPVYYDIRQFEIIKIGKQLSVRSTVETPVMDPELSGNLSLRENILDKQIVDLTGRKLVRVNDVRLVSLPSGTFVVAADVGAEGLVRRLGVINSVKALTSAVRLTIPSKFILWEDVDTLDTSNFNIKLGKPLARLQMLHPSDMADIIEELGRNNRTEVFSSLDEEKAADVLEEMEPRMQVDMIESLPVAKAADVLEKMPADEAADILDLLEDEKAEQLLSEMEKESSVEVRELLGYSGRKVGSIMSTDFISFHENETVAQALSAIREMKPEEPVLYNLFIVTHGGKLLATLSLRDLVVSEPSVVLKEIMHEDPHCVEDLDNLDSLAEMVSKYNLLAIPVVNRNKILEGMVVIDDIVDDLLGERKTR